jgi:D-lactate dehydrogenase (cytochrome)
LASSLIRARPPRGEIRRPATSSDAEGVASYLQDAARTPGGHTPLVLSPITEGEVAWAVREAPALLVVGAQSSLTGGATPFGEWLLSTGRLDRLGDPANGSVRAQAGVSLRSLNETLASFGAFFPPTPTYDGAFVGGVAATNAAGAATFKYGTTRDWVQALTVVLAHGDVLDLERGACTASDGNFIVELVSGERRAVPLPSYRPPNVPKCSSGYHAAPNMDLVDLFVGSEGTLGVITEVELKIAPRRPRLLGWLSLRSEARALEICGRLRSPGSGLAVASIESLDRRSLELLREDGADRAHGVSLASDAECVLLFAVEIEAGATEEDVLDRLSHNLGDSADGLLLATAGDTRRAVALEALREAVPHAVNRRVEEAQRRDGRIHKVAGDLIVRFERLGQAIGLYRHEFTRRGLDHAIWGHASDGNLHPNAIPRSYDDVVAAQQAILAMGEAVIAMGGAPMSEHGVGRNPVKQALLRRLYGAGGINEMRVVKNALDPEWRLAPGVLFPRASSEST